MQKLGTCLWFDQNAEEAVDFYTSVFEKSSKGGVAHYGKSGSQVSGQPEGSVMTVRFTLENLDLLALNGGPLFKFTPAISFYVRCQTADEVNSLFEKLSKGGSVLMPLDKYPFSERYAWINDKFGVSWQLNLDKGGTQKISPALMFVGKQHGRCEEAMKFYTGIFENSKIGEVARYAANEGGEEGKIKFARFQLNGQEFVAMENNGPHQFGFSLATSFMVNCENQKQVDEMWDKLSAGGAESQCGWLEDKFGVSWQVVPIVLEKLMNNDDKAKSEKVFTEMLKMGKLDIAALESASKR